MKIKIIEYYKEYLASDRDSTSVMSIIGVTLSG